MNTYELLVTLGGSDFKAYIQSNNPGFAFEKCRRKYPGASKISKTMRTRTKLIIKVGIAIISILINIDPWPIKERNVK